MQRKAYPTLMNYSFESFIVCQRLKELTQYGFSLNEIIFCVIIDSYVVVRNDTKRSHVTFIQFLPT